ncbi:MAG: UDP-N-acetylmuramoyl-L-alanine--D-glutamate ligase, partial [Bdellovibrionota bacterium]
PFLKAPTVAITGTNGKSTVTALVGKMLEAEGMKPFVGANFGRPVFEAIGGDFGSLVLELSSYQTETLASLQPRVAVLLNVTEDHLDRYPSFEEYRKAKAKLLALVPPEGTVIVNLDDPACVRSAEGIRAKVVGFTLEGKSAPAGWDRIVEEGKKALLPGGEKIDFSKTKLAGRHNVANLLAAIAAARSFGAGKSAIEKAIAEFQGLPHRCQFVAEVKGVRYYDDSKGTNVGAVVECLRGFEGPLILVAGGIGKGGSYAPLADAARGRVRHAILLGEDRKAIGKALSPVCAVEEVASMEEAVRRAYAIARSGESVLLSPACASFDMFRDYADRGDKFQQAVRSLS